MYFCDINCAFVGYNKGIDLPVHFDSLKSKAAHGMLFSDSEVVSIVHRILTAGHICASMLINCSKKILK
jgi:hypothetical protein